MQEARILDELHDQLQRAINANPNRGSIIYGKVYAEYPVNGFRADIVVFDEEENPIILIEAKRSPDNQTLPTYVDPYSPDNITQSLNSATELDSRYFVTYNANRAALFRAPDEPINITQLPTKPYDVTDIDQFAENLLNHVAALEREDDMWDGETGAMFGRSVEALQEYLSPENVEYIDASTFPLRQYIKHETEEQRALLERGNIYTALLRQSAFFEHYLDLRIQSSFIVARNRALKENERDIRLGHEKRVRVAYLLGLVTEEQRDRLLKMVRLRNKVAHSPWDRLEDERGHMEHAVNDILDLMQSMLKE